MFTVRNQDRDSISYYGENVLIIVLSICVPFFKSVSVSSPFACKGTDSHNEIYAYLCTCIVNFLLGCFLISTLLMQFVTARVKNVFVYCHFAALNRPDAKDTDIELLRDVIVDSLFCVLVSLGLLLSFTK